MPERLLVNFFYANPVGHVVEALRYAAGHRAAAPGREVDLALNADSPVELAALCPAVAAAYPVAHPLLEPCADSVARVAGLPREWDDVADDFRRHQPVQREVFPGLVDYYAATDAVLHARRRGVVGDPALGYRPHQPVHLDLPDDARGRARARLDPGRPTLALLPAGSSEAALYPATDSWLLVLDALADAFGDLQVVLVGRRPGGGRTATSVGEDDLRRLLAHRTAPVDGLDAPLVDQLALVEACDVLLSPHSGFGMATLAVATPWLTLSGGRWFEYFFNDVPFRSIVPDPDRWPTFSQFDPLALGADADGSPRTPTMTRARVVADLDRLVDAAGELIDGRVSPERALAEYVPELVAAHRGDTTAIWSIDDRHRAYL